MSLRRYLTESGPFAFLLPWALLLVQTMHGAYGLTLASEIDGACGLTLASEIGRRWLVQSPSHWLDWTLDWEEDQRPALAAEEWLDSQVKIFLLSGGVAEIDRESATTRLRLPQRPRPEALVHPYLGSTAAVVAWWQGHNSFHAGGFLTEDGVWGLLGDREQGKSSALGWLACRGIPVFDDDLLVVASGVALAGPRCLDLRRGASEHLGIGTWIGKVGARDRWRVSLPEVPPEAPLRGFIQLEWAEEVSVCQVPVHQRLGPLLANRGVRLPETRSEPWLDFLALPMLTLSRPQDWGQADKAMELLLERVSS
jgi:hypothetical protein